MAFRQRVQTATFFGAPLTRTRIFWTFALNRRRVRRCEWEIVFPNPGVLPHMSHTLAIRRAGYLRRLDHDDPNGY